MKRSKILFYGTGVLLLIVALGAISAGIGLMLEPDGSNLGMSVELLSKSPFQNFLIPGIVLLTFNGIGSLVGSFLSLKRHHLTSVATISLGVILIIWIGSQVYWLGLISILQPFFFAIGLLEIFLGGILLINKGQS